MKQLSLFLLIIFGTNNIFAQFTAGKSLSFDGTTKYVNTTFPGILGAGARTIEAWIKPGAYSGTGNDQRVICDYGATSANGYRYTPNIIGSTRNFRTEIGGNGSTGTVPLNDLKWHHIAVTYDPSAINKAATYVDGNLDWNGNYTLTVNTFNTTNFRIGVRIDNINYFLGEIDEVRFWSVARTATEIKDNMFKRVSTTSTNLVAYYDFDGAAVGAGGVPNLVTTSPYPGTMTNMTASDILTSLAPIHYDYSLANVKGVWSVNSTGGISDGLMLTASSLSNANDATYGNNSGSGIHTTSDVPSGVNERYTRIWSIDVNGTPSATLNFDLSTIEGTAITPTTAGNYVLLYRSTSSGNFTNVATASSIINTDQIVFSNYTLIDGYYTLGFITTPVLPIGGTTLSTSNPVCFNSPFTLSLSGASTITGQTYQWESSSNNITYTPIASATNATLVVSNPTTTLYYHCIVTSGSNSSTSSNLQITINALPIVTASSTATTFCAGQVITLNGGGATSYSWNNSAPNNSSFIPTISGSYQVTGTDANNCTATSTITLTVNPLPSVTASASSSAVCAGQSVILTGGGATSYTWDNFVTNNTSFIPTSTTTYQVTGTDANTCSSVSTVQVVVNTLPTVTASTSASSVCAGQSVTLTGAGASSYIWNNSVTNNTAFTPTATTTYQVTGTDANTCSSVSTVTVTVNALPTITATPATQIICENTPASISGGGGSTYSWNNGITDNTPFTVTASNTYQVTGTDANGCTGIATATVTMTAAPVVTASMTPTTVCAGNTATATGSGALSYSWNNSILDNTTFVAPTSTTTYQVTGTDAGGCTAISSVTLTVNTASGSLVTASSNSTNTQPDGSSVLYTNTNCDIIALVNDGAGGNILGSTQSNVTMMPTVGVYNGQPYVRRWYEITPTNNGAATITLYLTQADFDDYNLNNGSFPDLPLSGSNSDANIANIRITKVSGGTLGIGTPTVITPTMNWNGSYWEATFPVTGFSQFYFHSVNPFNSALPVTITDFKGQKTTSSNLISWTTSNETNNAYFTITYSQDGKNYTSLKRINSQANQGNSTAAISYSYEHTTPVMGHNYYKLEQVDIDGQKTTNTNVVDLVWGANGSTVAIYPNPTNDELNIDIYSTKVAHTQLRVVDMSGRTVQEVQVILQEGANHLEMNLSTIATGVYTIQILENNVVTQLHKVTKN